MHRTAALRFALFQRPACALGVAICAVLSGCSLTPADPATHSAAWLPTQPESASGYTSKPGWGANTFAVAAANPLATEAGYRILKNGGTAVDAAVAVQMVLGLVEPQSSGIGGGAFLLHSHGGMVQAYDGRETAPAAAHPGLLLQRNGQPLPFHEAMVGGLSVGTPGAVRMLEMAHHEHGKLPWHELFLPAIALAEQGFPISARLHSQIASDPYLSQDPAARDYFFNADGQALPTGTLRTNPAYAHTLRAIAHHGSSALHSGHIAQAIVDKVRSHPSNPGVLTTQDLLTYQARKRSALCHDWHPKTGAAALRSYVICGFPPPSSGAIAVGQILGMLSHTPAATMPLSPEDLPSADWLHYYSEAARLALADRAQYVADPDFVTAPGGSWQQLLNPSYLQARAQLIGSRRMHTAPAGQFATGSQPQAAMPEQPEYGTSHVSIVDRWGNALAMTSTIESQFGSRQMVHGFLLNNELTDFSFSSADANGHPVANRIQPGKRPRSSMAPTLVFDKVSGALVMSVGSPGGAHIIHYTAKVLQGVLGWGLSPQQAIDLPNFASFGGPVVLEKDRYPPSTAQRLEARGNTVQTQALTSGLQALVHNPRTEGPRWLGGADPRREGIVMGD